MRFSGSRRCRRKLGANPCSVMTCHGTDPAPARRARGSGGRGTPGRRCRAPRSRERPGCRSRHHAHPSAEVRAFVDAIQRLGRMDGRQVLSSKKSGQHGPPGLIELPRGVGGKRRERPGEERPAHVATRRSYEGLGYLGMLSGIADGRLWTARLEVINRSQRKPLRGVPCLPAFGWP